MREAVANLDGGSYRMEGLAVIGLFFGLVAFVRVEKLIKTLKEKEILDQDYKEE